MTARGLVLVTGASGFLGPYVVNALLRDGYRVRAAARSNLAELGAGYETILLPDISKTFHALPLVVGVDHVVHLAGLAHSSPNIAESTYQAVNAESARQFATAARRAGVKRFILMSSIRAQTGPAASHVLSEDVEPRPTDAYGRSKLAGEQAVREALAGLQTEFTILRPVLVYGAGAKGNLRTLAKLAASPWPLPIARLPGRRSLVSAENLAHAVTHCLQSRDVAGRTSIVAEDPPVTVAEIVAAMRAGLGKKAGMLPGPGKSLASVLNALGKADLAARLTGDLVADASALRSMGWQPRGETLANISAMMRAK